MIEPKVEGDSPELAGKDEKERQLQAELEAEIDEYVAAKKARGELQAATDDDIDPIIPWGEPVGPGEENLRHLEQPDDDKSEDGESP